jgi:phenylalanyl-tRNA synthetase alpha chain
MDKLKELRKEIEEDIKNLDSKELKDKYLSKTGKLTKALKGIQKAKDKATYGKEVNFLKNLIEESLQKNTSKDPQDGRRIDPTAPFDINSKPEKRPSIPDIKGSSHVMLKERNKILEIFQRMGFDVMESRQIDDDYHMFESLNFPKGHPAREMYDTFWTDDNFVLPAHTSTMQNRVLKFFEPPIKVVLPGRCFRNEATDASHEHTFYQLEGIYVSRNASLGDMISVIKNFLEEYFETKIDVKMQPAYFPFTEPDLEFVMSCPFCDKQGCSICGQSGWIELMGCGMINPEVLKSANIDSEEYSGFAWGVGVDRLVIMKKGIEDIRDLRSGDINFLQMF